MDSPKKNPDKLNTIGIVTVGAVGSALVYLSIVGLQAFYVSETSQPDTLAAFGDQDKARASLKAGQIGNLTESRRMWATEDGKQIVSLPIDAAKALVARDARVDAANLVPAVRRSDKATMRPIFGRPIALPPAPVPPVEPPPIAPGDPVAPAGGEVVPPGGAPATGTTPAPAGVQPATPPTPPAPSPAPAGAQPTPAPAPVTPAPAAGAQ